jgi:hypothetical protein
MKEYSKILDLYTESEENFKIADIKYLHSQILNKIEIAVY